MSVRVTFCREAMTKKGRVVEDRLEGGEGGDSYVPTVDMAAAFNCVYTMDKSRRQLLPIPTIN